MQFNHQPASHIFTTALLQILRRTETMLQRKSDAGGRHAQPEDLRAGAEVEGSDWGAWVEAGGDLLMGNNPGRRDSQQRK